jgi:hypothetical protein
MLEEQVRAEHAGLGGGGFPEGDSPRRMILNPGGQQWQEAPRDGQEEDTARKCDEGERENSGVKF